MNCEQVRSSISGFADDSLSGILHQAIANHVKRCDSCTLVLAQEQLLVEFLADSPAPEPRRDFFTDALRKAREHHEGPDLGNVPLGVISAAACFLFGVFLTVLLQGNIDTDSDPSATGIELTVEENKQLDIHLQVSVSSDIDNAMMVIEVPPSLQIVGFEGINVLEWPVLLKKGKNVLALPVKARRHFSEDQVSHLIARLKTGTQQKDFDIKVTIKSSQNNRQEALRFNPATEYITASTLGLSQPPVRRLLRSVI
jgi:Putative zinc-finger